MSREQCPDKYLIILLRMLFLLTRSSYKTGRTSVTCTRYEWYSATWTNNVADASGTLYQRTRSSWQSLRWIEISYADISCAFRISDMCSVHIGSPRDTFVVHERNHVRKPGREPSEFLIWGAHCSMHTLFQRLRVKPSSCRGCTVDISRKYIVKRFRRKHLKETILLQ